MPNLAASRQHVHSSGIKSRPAASKSYLPVPSNYFIPIKSLFPAGVGQRQQFFRTTPGDSFVPEGGRAILTCVIGDLGGRVQWTKDGLTLGKSDHTTPYHTIPQCSIPYCTKDALLLCKLLAG